MENIRIFTIYVANRTIYIRNEDLWSKARDLAGAEGLSNVIQELLARWVRAREAEVATESMTEVDLAVGGEAYEDEHGVTDDQRLAFAGRLVADSNGLSVAQIPRVRVYHTKGGKLIVYRSWKGTPAEHLGATYRVYPNYESLGADRGALDTMWIEGDPERDRKADHTSELRRQVTEALGRDIVVRID
jgi:hypothetical protein